ncbi:hypothetical protein AB0I81_22620 [Nonomuraea sp. NPDC050404]|uniref:hypothetical protein n=1 Tax=Nonomuraea sp. NPDC050404 TaxID=3155783 RepID=UPI0033D35314
MGNVRLLAALLAAVLAVAACGPPPSGVVVGREYDAPTVKSKKVCTTSGAGAAKRSTCTNKPMYEPAEWELTLRVGQDLIEVDVSQAAHEACAEGETYPACAEGS